MDDTFEDLKELERIVTLATDRIEQIKKKAAEPPVELRHGDYGMDSDGRNCITLKLAGSSGSLRQCDEGEGLWTHAVNDCGKPKTILGNIFDDLKALGEDVFQFETEYGGETLHWSLSPQCKDLTIDSGNATNVIRKSDIPGFILDLRTMLATHKRKEQK